jgi:chemotaxis protein CheX
MSGDVVGTIILSFRCRRGGVDRRAVLRREARERTPDFADAVGELVNMVSGGAKAMFTDTKDVSISCPSVIVGKDHGVALPSDVPCVVIPCTTDCGEFVIEIAIREAGATAAAAANNASATA